MVRFMNHDDHVRLIEAGVGRNSGGLWADFGAGSGAFTLALRDIAGPDVEIYAVDRDRGSLRSLQSAMDRSFPGTNLQLLEKDFTAELALPPLDGILSANAIHYVPDQVGLLRRWRGYLKPAGRLLIVEYDTDRGNRWVPYPLSFPSFSAVAQAAGLAAPKLIGTRPSRFLNGFYTAVTFPI
jgi:ubiquinone/menaquinone biosynthesis C-methylase UbiE